MASATAPTTPEATAPFPLMRRSFTLPPKLPELRRSSHSSKQEDKPAVETLFAHHNCKIVSFTASSGIPKTTSNSGRGNDDVGNEPVGILPWKTNSERTIAAGPFCIHRVPGTVAFLNSGDKVHPILPKSRSWCVDGKTKLVLRIRPNTYYRFELPNTCPEDLQAADDLKKVFMLVSQYETTPCPFVRDFTVELPATPKTPIQKRPWKPKHQPTRIPGERIYAPRNTLEPVSDESSTEAIEEESISRSSKESLLLEQRRGNGDEIIMEALKTPTRLKAFSGGRAVTAPPQLMLKPELSSSTENSMLKKPDQDVETASLSSSVDSFYSIHSFHSPISPLPPSPPYSDPPSPSQKREAGLGIDVPRTRQHKRDTSDLTITAETFPVLNMSETPSWPQKSDPSTPILPQTPALTNDAVSPRDDSWSEAVTPSSQTSIRHRPYASRRRTHSPLPPSANLYSPRTRMSGHHLTTALLQKTCSLLLGPPVQLVALMLNIAARIANGTFGKSLASKEGSRSIPCTWEYSDAEDEARDLWEEDDYGISLGVLPTSKVDDVQGTGQSWDID